MGDQRVFWKLELELSQEFLEQLIDVFPMTHVMDLNDMALMIKVINNAKSFRSK